MTSGINRRYHGCMLDRNRRTDRYTENRTTAFKDSETGMAAVEIGRAHV
jgi:hypothetical protein